MKRDEVLRALGTCYSGEPASCSYACPFHLDLRSFLKKMARGRFDAAYRELCEAIPFPTVSAALCSAKCENACQCSTVVGGDAVCIRTLERSCLHLAKNKVPLRFTVPEKPERVAIVGAGAAGLGCALILARKKYRVTVIERESGWGGSLRKHPDFPVFEQEFVQQFSTEMIDLRLNQEIRTLDELRDFDTVLLACGKGGDTFGLLNGWDSELLSTKQSGIFLAGEICGCDVVEAMAQGFRCARSIEAYLQTKNPENARENWNEKNACRYAPHAGAEATAALSPDDGDVYSAVQAKAEAGRCLQCDCKECLNVCELMQQYRKLPSRVASDVLQDGESRNSVSSAAITRETWSCNLCGRCAEKCSEGTDIGTMLHLSRIRRVEGKLFPPAVHSYWLREMEFAAGDGALTLPGKGNYVFFPGCRLGAANPDYVTKSYAILKAKYGAGLVLNCCGIPAYWAGEAQIFEAHLSKLREMWENFGKPVFVFACASCRRLFTKQLPEIRTASLYEMLPIPQAAPTEAPKTAAVFDPCAAAPFSDTGKAVRALAERCGAAVTDYTSDGKCCGFGGHMRLANPNLYRQITKNRGGDAAEPYIVYCTNCRETLRGAGKECTHILDLYFNLQTGNTTLEQKRRNAIRLKDSLMREHGLGNFEIVQEPWETLTLELTEELQQKADELLIPLCDIQQVLWNAEKDGSGFLNAENEILAFHEFEAVTVWVKAKKMDERQFQVLEVYSHRMRVGKGSAE